MTDSATHTPLTTDSNIWTRMVDNRREDRVDFRTTGFVYPLTGEEFSEIGTPIRIWTLDVSTVGVLIRSYDEIEDCERLLVELVLPQLKNSVIEAKIVRSSEETLASFAGKEQTAFLYGLEFLQLIKKEEVEDILPERPDYKSAPPMHGRRKGDSKANSTSSRLKQESDSYIPLLSAIGLAVVHAALLFVFS